MRLIGSKNNQKNLTVDMLVAAIKHYKVRGRRIKSITVHPLYWNLFKEYMNVNAEDIKFDDEIQFRNVLLRKGSKKQTERLEIELQTIAE